MDWFTSDTHFGHANIIRYSNRPFKSVEEMDDVLIKNINQLVQPNDTLWHLGDFCFGPRDKDGFVRVAANYRKRINCQKVILIHGNHDPDPYSYRQEEREKADAFMKLFYEHYPMRRTTILKQKMHLCHYSFRVWDKSHGGAWNLYGHSHGSLPDDPNAKAFDCGVDCHNYKPLSFHDVAAIMAKKVYKPVDHHGA
jgi:calcineurin-like phosphoesterase family protein